MSALRETYLGNLHQYDKEMLCSDWGDGGTLSFESNPCYPQEGLHMQWDTPDPSFYTYSPCFPASSPFSSPPFTSPQINAVNGVSVAHGRDAPTHEFHFNNTHYIQAPGDDLPTTDIMTAALFDFHLGNQLGVQHQSTNYDHNPHTPLLDVSPFSSPCPASASCSCTGLTRRQIMNLPHFPHLGYKRTRATGAICRKALLERFDPSYRGLAIEILCNPDVQAKAALLGRLMAPPLDHVQGNGFKHGCLCCPNAARCQSQQKVERHLRGLFNVRPFLCRYCRQGSIDTDDNRKHENVCRLKAKSIVSSNQP